MWNMIVIGSKALEKPFENGPQTDEGQWTPSILQAAPQPSAQRSQQDGVESS